MRSQKGEGLRKEGDGGEGKKEGKKDAQKVLSCYQNSYQSCFLGVYLVFEVFQDTWHSNKDNSSVYWHATPSCPLMASNYANWYLVRISFRSGCGC